MTAQSTISAYADVEDRANPVVGMLQERGVPIYKQWGRFASQGLGTAEAAVLLLPTLREPIYSRLVRMRMHRLALPLMLITEYHRENARVLPGLDVDELLFLDEVSASALTLKLIGLGRGSMIRLAGAALRENEFGLDPEVAVTLGRACAPHCSVGSVADLARIMGYSRSQFERRWARCTPPGSHPHLFVEWLRLVRALEHRKCTRQSWARIASAHGVRRATLSETAKRLFHCNLAHLQHLKRDRLLAKLSEILGGTPKELL